MNSYYVEYFKEMRGVQSEDLGAAVRPGTEHNRKTDAGYINTLIREHVSPKDPSIIENLAKALGVSPLWFTCAPCLVAIEDLHYYLKTVPSEDDMEGRGYMSNYLVPVIQKDCPICFKFEIANEELAKALATYQEQKKKFWNGTITAAEWDAFRYNCLKKSPEFRVKKGRSMKEFIDMFDDLTLTQCADKLVSQTQTDRQKQYNESLSRVFKKSNDRASATEEDEEAAKALAYRMTGEETAKLKGPEEVTKQGLLREMRKYYNGVSAPGKDFAKRFCMVFKDYGMTPDLWYCDFYFTGWEDFYNLIIVADIMVCPMVFSNVDKKAFVTFDKKTFTSAVITPVKNVILDSQIYDDNDDDDDESEMNMPYDRYEARSRMNFDSKFPVGKPAGSSGGSRRGGQ